MYISRALTHQRLGKDTSIKARVYMGMMGDSGWGPFSLSIEARGDVVGL